MPTVYAQAKDALEDEAGITLYGLFDGLSDGQEPSPPEAPRESSPASGAPGAEPARGVP
jgi:hypothetical protein